MTTPKSYQFTLMTPAQDELYREHFGDATVTRPKANVFGMLERDLLISAYRPANYTRMLASTGHLFTQLTPEAQFLYASVKWRRTAAALQHVHPTNAAVQAAIKRSYVCTPCGYYLESHRKSLRWSCGRPLCPHCHARSVTQMYMALVNAYQRKPKDVPLYIGTTYAKSPRADWAMLWFKKHRTAGGVVYRYRDRDYENTPDDSVWCYELAAFSDVRSRLTAAGLSGVTKIESTRRTIAFANILSRIMRYPRIWDAKRPVYALEQAARRYENIPNRAWRYRRFGACNAGYVPGASWLDFAAAEVPDPQGCPHDSAEDRSVR